MYIFLVWKYLSHLSFFCIIYVLLFLLKILLHYRTSNTYEEICRSYDLNHNKQYYIKDVFSFFKSTSKKHHSENIRPISDFNVSVSNLLWFHLQIWCYNCKVVCVGISFLLVLGDLVDLGRHKISAFWMLEILPDVLGVSSNPISSWKDKWI